MPTALRVCNSSPKPAAGSHGLNQRLTGRLVQSRMAVLALAISTLPLAGHAVSQAAAAKPPAAALSAQKLADPSRIAAVVNGDVITNNDIDNRARLFALSTGLTMSPDVLDHLKPQILRQLVDERLRVQEAQRRKIVIQDKQIADAIHDIEQRNNMQPGALRAKLAADGVSTRTLIDQIRAQLAWGQVLHDLVAEKLVITDADVQEQQKLETQMIGQPEYRLGEIFIPVDDPSNSADAQHFAETVISELHAGAPFPLVAAQFSQTQTALEGGEIGWVQSNQLDPQVARLVKEMPVGAISNPVKVPGGFTVVTLQGKREVGRDISTVVTMRQAFVAFTTLLDPQAPTEQQRQALARAREISATVHSCEQMEQVAKSVNAPSHAVDPGEVRVDSVNPPAFRQLLGTIPIGKATEPLVSRDGIAVISVCTRDEKNTAEITPQEVRQQLLNEHVEQISRQTMRDLHRQASIDLRSGGV